MRLNYIEKVEDSEGYNLHRTYNNIQTYPILRNNGMWN